MTEALPYPKSIAFLISNEFCERFNYYGLRAVLSLYITEVLLYTERQATIIYHFFAMAVYAFPLFGAMIADSWLGKFKTIFYISILYASGNVTLAMSAIKQLRLPPRAFSLLGLMLIAVGSGGIKPCVSAFGGDQFVLPQQQHQLDGFFHLFYFAINAGSFLSMFITPVLRKGVHCFGEDSCYPLAFFVPAVLMVLAVVVFVMGRPLYRIQDPSGNMVLKVSGCIGTALNEKRKSNGVKKEHWLDFAIEKHGETLVGDIKVVIGILFLYLPLPLFWALFEQQATGWTFQARQLNGEIGNLFTIFPDQMQVVNPTFILVLIPIFNYIVYPLFAKMHFLRTPLQRIASGGIMAGCAYLITSFLSFGIEHHLPALPSAGNGQIRIYNVLPCAVTLNCSGLNDGKEISIPQLSVYTQVGIPVSGSAALKYTLKNCAGADVEGELEVKEKEASAYIFNGDEALYLEDDVRKSVSGGPNVRTILNLAAAPGPIEISFTNSRGPYRKFNSTNMTLLTVNADMYTIQLGDTFKFKQKFSQGGVYTLCGIAKSADEFDVKAIEVTRPNQIHILWMIPQYFVITVGELMFSVTGLEFSYAEAPSSMKAVLQASWLLTVAFGQLFVIILEYIVTFEKQSLRFLVYAAIMFGDMAIFIAFAICYKYKNVQIE